MLTPGRQLTQPTQGPQGGAFHFVDTSFFLNGDPPFQEVTETCGCLTLLWHLSAWLLASNLAWAGLMGPMTSWPLVISG